MPNRKLTVSPLMPLLMPLIAVALAVVGCAPRMVLDPEGVGIIRTYQFSSTVADPQPAWNPQSDVLVVRSLNGFGLLQEGRGRQEYFDSVESRQTWFPAWINRGQFVFGPQRNVIALGDGRVVASTDGLSLVNVLDNGLKCEITRDQLSPIGFGPRPAGEVVYAQVDDTMIVIDQSAKRSDAGQGFAPEPQVGGPGICWRDVPLGEPDHWQGKGGRGTLFIRWKPGQLTEVPGGCQARWTADGGVVCTVMRAVPTDTKPWWTGGTDVVYLSGPDVSPVVVAKDCRSPAPHPSEPLVAVADGAAGVSLVSLRTPPTAPQLLTAIGGAPLWNHDGSRLLAVDQSQDGQPAVITVYVLKETRTTL